MFNFIKNNWIFVVVFGFAIAGILLAKNGEAPGAASLAGDKTALLADSLGTLTGTGAVPAQSYDAELYFNNSLLGPTLRCDEVFPAKRALSADNLSASDALRLLLAGPTAAEQFAGYFTSLGPGVRVRNFAIENGRAVADFSSDITLHVAPGSCRAQAIRAQIEKTLAQFPDVKEVAITVNGSAQNALAR